MEAVGQSVKIGQHKIKVVKNNGKKWENSGKTVETSRSYCIKSAIDIIIKYNRFNNQIPQY